MAANSKIEWTDHTFNPWWGCTKVAAGCTHCYAEALSKRLGRAEWGDSGTRMLTKDWSEPLKWNAAAERAGVRQRVFCSSMADVFEDWSGHFINHKREPVHCIKGEFVGWEGMLIGQSLVTMSDVRQKLFKLIDATPWLDWLLLTKRPENIRRMWYTSPAFAVLSKHYGPNGFDAAGGHPEKALSRKNVWLLTSVAEQKDADKNIPELLKCRDLSPVLGLSIEPLIEAVDVSPWLGSVLPSEHGQSNYCLDGIDWVIVGGESGPGARPMHPDWARSLRNQCAAADVPFFFKQWGEWKPISEMTEAESSALYRSNRIAKPHESQEELDDVHGKTCRVETQGIQYDGAFGWNGGDPFHIPYQTFKVGKKHAGRLLDGVTHDALPVRA